MEAVWSRPEAFLGERLMCLGNWNAGQGGLGVPGKGKGNAKRAETAARSRLSPFSFPFLLLLFVLLEFIRPKLKGPKGIHA